MINSLKIAAPALVSAALLAAALAVPASAAPVVANAAVMNEAVADGVTRVHAKKKWRRAYGYAHPGYGPDTVGSLGYDGRGYGYNRFSGQVYFSCMEDLGYGRVRPCDAGRR